MSVKKAIGLIGCGDHALKNLSPALKKIKEIDLAACADIDDSALDTATELFGYKRKYNNYSTMLAEENLDGVVVSLPHYLLKDAVIESLKNQVHVFVEKPMATNMNDGIAIREAAKENGVGVMVGFCVRYSEGRIKTKTLIEEGAIGEILHVNAVKGGGDLEGLPTKWQSDPSKGGGPLLWLGSHMVDQILWIVGEKPSRVHAESVWHERNGTEKKTSYSLRFASGTTATGLCSQDFSTIKGFLGNNIDSVEVFGTAGRIRSQWPSNIVEIFSEVKEEYRHLTTIHPRSPDNPPMYFSELDSWVRSLIEKTVPPVTVEDGINMLELVDALSESSRTGLTVLMNQD